VKQEEEKRYFGIYNGQISNLLNKRINLFIEFKENMDILEKEDKNAFKENYIEKNER